MKKVAFHNLGCKVNAYETEHMQQQFEEKGYEIVPFAKKADIYVINTCSVTNIADRKSRQMIHRARNLNPKALIVATGCYVQTNTGEAECDECIDILIGNNEKSRVLEIVEEYLLKAESGKEIIVPRINEVKEYEDCILTKTCDHTRVYIKIQDGCNQFCSYCIIPYARGRVRSRSIDSILKEAGLLAEAGYKEVVLTGIHLSSYGLDHKEGNVNYNSVAGEEGYTNKELIEVIKKVDSISGIERIRLGSLEPRIITEEFMNELSTCESFCPHFHLSLQSGSDAVLKRMNRHYSAGEYARKVELIRKYYPHAAITTDVIVGFPGETTEEFEESRQFLEQVNFYEVHVFKYSRRRGTPADKMKDQLTERIKSERSNVLIEEGRERTKAFLSKYLGQKVSVLTEDKETIDGKEYFTGYTKNYMKTCMILPGAMGGEIVEGVVTGLKGDAILEVSPIL